MYKARLSQWGISKNYSDKDYQICAVLHHTRQNNGKRATAFVIHGHKRSLKDLHKYIKGRKMTEDEFLAAALKNVHCNSENDQQQEEQYAHVRAYTPEPEAEGEDQQQSSSSSSLSAPARAQLGEIAANSAVTTHSPTGTGTESVSGVSGSGSRSTTNTTITSATTYRDSPTSQKRSPPDKDSPSVPLTLATPLTPSTRRMHSTEFPPRESPALVTWQPSGSQSSPSSRAPLASSPLDVALSASLSYTYSTPNAPPGPFEDQIHHVGTMYDTSPIMTCQRLCRDVEFMARQIVDAPPLKSLCGHDDIYSLRLLSDTSSVDSQDYEQICPTCHELTRDHFISLDNLETPQHPRSILNETHDLRGGTISVPASSRGHEHSWKWVARCFAACIYLSRGNDTLSRRSLADADVEFEKMLIPRQDPKVLLALNQTLMILQMHDQGDVTKTIMRSAYNVAERLLGPDEPLTTITRWMVYVANGQMRTSGITSSTLCEVHDEFVSRYGHDDPRSIASKYCYGFMLNVESRLEQAEQVLREVYVVSSAVLGPRHLQSISALTNLNRCLERQGRVDEAINILQQAIYDSKDTLGENHPRRLESMRLLAMLYEQQGRMDLVEGLYWRVLEGRIKMLGRNHKYTQGMKRDLEELLQRLGKWSIGDGRKTEESAATTEVGERRRPRGKAPEATETESEAQLRIQDLFEWDPDEKWDDARSADGSDETGSQHEAF